MHGQLDVHPVEERARDAPEVPPLRLSGARAVESLAASLAARAWIGRENELESGGVRGGAGRPVDDELAALERLAERVQYASLVLRSLIEKWKAHPGSRELQHTNAARAGTKSPPLSEPLGADSIAPSVTLGRECRPDRHLHVPRPLHRRVQPWTGAVRTGAQKHGGREPPIHRLTAR